jgi:hypothetical protein
MYSVFLPSLDLTSYFIIQAGFINNLVVSAVIFVYVLFAGAVFIRIQLDCFHVKTAEVSVPDVGRLIGLLERAIILILVMYNEITAVGFVLAAKSIARFKQLEDRPFAEYYLIGTLISALMAVIGGLLLNAVWR